MTNDAKTDKRKKNIDWEKIEQEYSLGLKTLREIAGEHNISHVAIARKAKAESWTKDLSAKINKKADELVNKLLVNNCRNGRDKSNDKELIDANAQVIVEIKLSHRKDIKKLRDIALQLSDELQTSDDLELSQRTRILKDLTDINTKLIDKERQAFAMDKEIVQVNDPIKDLITSIAKSHKSTFGIVADDPEYNQT